MAPVMGHPSLVVNPLATPEQLLQSASALAGVPRKLETAILYHACCIIQAAGVLLRLPQPMVAETLVIFQRFWVGTTGGNLLLINVKDVAAASLYLNCKSGQYPLSPRQLLDTFFYVIYGIGGSKSKHSAPVYTEGQLDADRAALIMAETNLLKVLGYQIHTTLPHNLSVSYLQTLGCLTLDEGHELARRAYAHLNGALLSPQLLYLTHQPNALATAAIYLAAKEVGVTLSEQAWWEIFDVDREELGFLVVALLSMPGFALSQRDRNGMLGTPPLTSQDLHAVLDASGHASTG